MSRFAHRAVVLLLLLEACDDGTARHRLARHVHPGLSFSPDGSATAYAAGDAPELDVFVVSLSGDIRNLTPQPGPQYLPAFDASGDAVLYTSGGPSGPSIYLTNLHSGAPRELLAQGVALSPPDGAVSPAVSGEQVAWFDGVGVTAVDRAASVHRIEGARGAIRDPAGGLLVLHATGELAPWEVIP